MGAGSVVLLIQEALDIFDEKVQLGIDSVLVRDPLMDVGHDGNGSCGLKFE